MNLNNPTLNKIFANSLSVRGAGNEYHKLAGVFRTKAEANAAVVDGSTELINGALNLALVGGQGLMIYSFDLGTWISAIDWTEFAVSADSFIAFDGDNDYIEFTEATNGSENLGDFSKSWSIGFTFVDFSDMTDNKKMTLFSNGGNHITLLRGAGQDALYISGTNGATWHGANVWYNMHDNRRVLFSYDHTVRKLTYYVGNGDGGFNKRAVVNVDAGAGIGGGAGSPDGIIRIGKGAGTLVNFHGAMDKMIVRDAPMSDVQVHEFFANIDRDYTKLSFYADLTSFVNMGEDVYPNVVDLKGNLLNGVFNGGASTSFKLTPTE